MPYNIRQQPIFFSTGDPETVNDQILQYPGQLGMRATVQQPGPRGAASTTDPEANRAKTYQLIQTDSTATVAPYRGATAWKTNAPYVVTTSATNRNQVAGVFQSAITPGWFGFIQVEGPATVKLIDASAAAPAIGTTIIPSSTDGKADNLAVGTAPTHTVMGRVSQPLTFNAGSREVVVDLAIPDTV
jgi:hypothetical protein